MRRISKNHRFCLCNFFLNSFFCPFEIISKHQRLDLFKLRPRQLRRILSRNINQGIYKLQRKICQFNLSVSFASNTLQTGARSKNAEVPRRPLRFKDNHTIYASKEGTVRRFVKRAYEIAIGNFYFYENVNIFH